MGIAKKLDCEPGDGVITAPNLNQECAVNVFSFFRLCAANGLCNVISSFNGNGGSGENYHDAGSPLGENAWIVTEWDQGAGQTFYVLFQWCDAEAPGTGGGAPWLLDAASSGATDGLGFSMAVTDSGVSPWNGTIMDNGADTKGTPVWVDNGSTVHCFPRSNSPGGSHNTNKQNSARVGDHSVGRSRMHLVANENTISIVWDIANSGLYSRQLMMGRYTPSSNMTALATTPFFMASDDNGTGAWYDLGSSQRYGGVTGSDAQNGGVIGLPVNSVMDMTLNTPSVGQLSTFYQPNRMTDPNEFEPTACSFFGHESGKTAGPNGTGDFGQLGTADIEVVSAIYNTINQQTNALGTRAYLGNSTTAVRKHNFPWDAGAAPGNETVREGRESFTA